MPAKKSPTSAPKPKSAAKAVAKPPVDAPIAAPVVVETPARKTVMPKASPAGAAIAVAKAPTPLTYERIAVRAYYISQNGNGGSEYDNWLRAEAELKGEA